MIIYVVHSSGFDYQNELYKPLGEFNRHGKHTIILPHAKNESPMNSKHTIATSDLVIAEVSYPSTGMGIELGWADDADIPVLCIHKAEFKVSSSLPLIFKDFIAYNNAADLVEKLIGALT